MEQGKKWKKGDQGENHTHKGVGVWVGLERKEKEAA